MTRITVAMVIKAALELREEQIISDYDHGNGLTVTQLHQKHGMNRESIYRRLQRAGVYTRPGKSGPPLKDLCGKNLHDMEEHGKPATGGGRYCSACKRERQRKKP